MPSEAARPRPDTSREPTPAQLVRLRTECLHVSPETKTRACIDYEPPGRQDRWCYKCHAVMASPTAVEGSPMTPRTLADIIADLRKDAGDACSLFTGRPYWDAKCETCWCYPDAHKARKLADALEALVPRTDGTPERLCRIADTVKHAFYSGAAAMLELMTRVAPDDVSEDQGVEMLTRLHEELHAYADRTH